MACLPMRCCHLAKQSKPWMFNVTDIPWSSRQALTIDISYPENVCIRLCLAGREQCCRQPAWLSHSPADDLAPCLTWQPAAGLGQHNHLGVKAESDYLRITQPIKKECCHSIPLPSSSKSLEWITTSPEQKISVFILATTLRSHYPYCHHMVEAPKGKF